MGKWVVQAEMEFAGDIIITDPCYLHSDLDWDEKEAFCKDHGLVSRTYYGDWGCTVYKTTGKAGTIRSGEEIGKFCADGGMVCVLDIRDALDLNPGFAGWMDEHQWCVTKIKGFKGTVKLIKKETKQFFKDNLGNRIDYVDTELRVRGEGTVNGEPFTFESKQTSL